jgi:hypothetical protein
MRKITLLTPWSGTGLEDKPYRPQILIDYPSIKKFKDITGSYNFSRNLFIVECEVPNKLYKKLRLDSRYFILKEESQ